MSSSIDSSVNQTERKSRGHCCGNWSRQGNWSVLNIAVMVMGFIVFWPIGLFILFWIISGRNVKELPKRISEQWWKATGNWSDNDGSSSDNEVFNQYQQTQYDRMSEIKEEIKDRAQRFTIFRKKARQRADEVEFNRFMSEAPERSEG